MAGGEGKVTDMSMIHVMLKTVLAGLLVMGAACVDEDPGGPVTDTPVPPATRDTIAFFEDPGELVGQQVTLNVQVREVVDRNVFRFSRELHDEPSYIAVNPGGDFELKPENEVTITGVVVEFDLDDVRERLSLEADDVRLRRYEGDFAVYADSVVFVSAN